MQKQRGFIGLPVLIMIVLGLAVLGGGTYFVLTQKSNVSNPATTNNVPAGQKNIDVQTSVNQPPQIETPKSTAVPTTASEVDETLAAAKSATPSDVYVRYNNNFYSRIEGTYNFIKVIGADLATFEILRDSWGYAKDKNYVYYYGKPTSFDPKTFVLLGDYYAKDNVSVYFIREKMEADAATFSVLRDPSSLNSYSRFSKDKDRIYFQSKPIIMNPKELPPPDAKSFTLIDAAYAKDSSRVYYIAEYNSATGMDVISGADAGTFAGLGAVISAKDVVNYAYAKDKSQVYFYNKILPGVDVGTFEFVGTTGCSDVSCAPIVTKDKQCIYLNNDKVLGTNGVCINSNTCTKATINSGCGVK